MTSKPHQQSFHQFFTQAYILTEQFFFPLPQKFQLLFLILGQLQTISYVPYPIIEEHAINQKNLDYGMKSYLSFFAFFSRPHLLITNYEAEAYLIILFSLLVILIFYLFLYYFYSPDNLTLKEQLQSTPFLIQLSLRLISIFGQLMNVCLIIPFTEMALRSFYLGFYNSSIAHQVFATITICFYQVYMVFKFWAVDQAMLFNNIGFEKLHLTYLDYLIYILKLTQCFIYIFEENLITAIYIHKILLIFIAFAYTFNLTQHTPVTKLCHIKIILYIQGLSLTIGMMHAVVVTIPSLSQNLSTLIFLIFPLTSQILLKKWNYQEIQIWMTDLDNPFHLLFFISLIARSDQQLPHSLTLKLLSESIHLKNHRQKCVKVDCKCQQGYQMRDIQKVVFLNDDILKELEEKLISRLDNQMKLKKNPYTKVSYLLHFCQSLLAFGFYLESFKKCCYLQSKIKLKQLQKQSIVTEFLSENEILKFKIQNEEFKISYFQQQRINLLKDEAKIQINKQITLKIHSSQELAQGIGQFLNSEQQLQILQNELIRLLNDKVTFLNMLIATQSMTMQNFFKQCTQLAEKLFKFEEQLISLYLNFPSGKLQNFCSFVDCEVINNYFMAMKISHTTIKPEERILKIQQILNIDLLSNKMTYLIISFNETTMDPLIKASSKNAHDFFLYNQDMFKPNRSLEFLIPPTIRHFHTTMVKKFFLTGYSSYFRQRNTNFGLLNDRFLEPFDFYFDLNFLDMESFSVAAFFQVVEFIYPYIMLDSNLMIGAVSKSFFEQIGFSKNQTNKINLIDFFFKQSITTFLPDFEVKCLINEPYFQISCTNIALKFLKKTILLDQFNVSKVSIERTQINSEKSQWNNYECNLQVLKKQIDEYHYYILKFENIKILKQKDEIEEYIVQVNSEEIHKKKLEFLKSKIKVSREVENSLHENVLIDEPYGEQSYRFEEDKISQLSNKSLNFKSQQDQRRSKMMKSVGLVQNWIRASKQFLYTKLLQQRYFSHLNQNQHSSDQKSVSLDQAQQQLDQFQQIGSRQMDKDLKVAFLDQIEAENKRIQKSQVSTASAFQKSELYRNIELINKIVSTGFISNEFKLLSMIFTCFYTLNAIYAVIVKQLFYSLCKVLNNIGPDLTQFLAKTEILQINNYFLEPLEIFLISYHSLLKYNSSYSQYPFQKRFSDINLNYSYERLKRSFEIRIQAPYFEDIFEQLEIYELDYSSHISPLNITLKNALHNLLNYEYQYIVKYHESNNQNYNQSGEPQLIYIIANYLTFTNKFNYLNDIVLKYTLSETEIVVFKWYTLMVPFMIIGTMFIFMAWLAYNRHIKKYYTILKLFTIIENYWLDRELERLKMLIQFSTSDEEIFFRYRFQLGQKERHLQREQEKKRHQVNYSNQQKRFGLSQGGISIICSVITFLFLLCLFFGYQIVINASTQTYFGNYKTTITFFRNFSNLEYLTVSIYNKREILKRIDQYLFFSPNSKQQFLKKLERQLEELNQFQDLITSFNSEKYLVGTRFIYNFDTALKGNICQYLEKVELLFLIIKRNIKKDRNFCVINMKIIYSRED